MKLSLFLAALAVLCPRAVGQDPVRLSLESDIIANPLAPGFGRDLALSGSHMAVSDREGGVHLYSQEVSGWKLERSFFGGPGEGFGSDLAVGQDVLAVGAVGFEHGPNPMGSVSIFRKSSDGQWYAAQKLSPTGGVVGARFGQTLELKGTLLAVSAPGAGAGEVHLFDSSSGAFVPAGVVTPGDGVDGDQFGFALALDGPLLCIGAPMKSNGTLVQAGAVYLFRQGALGFSFESKLLPFDPTAHANFGFAVASTIGEVYGGAPGGRVGSTVAGKAYQFKDTGGGAWFQTAQVLSPLGRPLDRFGNAISAMPGRVFVSAYGDDFVLNGVAAFGVGSVNIYDTSGAFPTNEVVFIPPSAEALAWSGTDIAVEGSRVAIGIPGRTNTEGAVEVYQLSEQVGGHICDPAVQHSGSVSAQIAAYGDENLSSSTIDLLAYNLPTTSFGVFIVGDQTAMSPGYMGGQGTLCVTAPFGIFVNQVAKSGQAGQFEATASWANLPLLGGASVGSTYTFQAWFRDRNPASTTNFSDAVSVTLQ